jgi:two-component system sensor histidine kinase VicK
LPQDAGTQRTDVQYGDENAMKIVLGFLSRATRSVDTCGDSTMPSVAVGVEPVRQFTVGLSRQGLKLRSITEITKANLQYCKELAQYVQLRHMSGIKGSFALRDSAEYVGTTTLEEARPLTQVISSNVRGMVEQHQYLFETLWGRAVPAQQRFREIEEGLEPEFMSVVADPGEAAEIFVGMARKVSKEALMLLPDSRSLGMMYDNGVLQHLAHASRKNAVVRIICPLDVGNADVADWIANNAHGFRIINAGSSRSTILLTDSSRYFRAELREAGASGFSESLGFAIHSNSRPTVSSFKSFFELLWKSATLNEELRKADRMQRESGSLRLNKGQFSLDEVIENAIKDVRGQYGGEDARIIHMRSGIVAHADKHRISQVVLNLLSNAAKFAEGGTVVIEPRAAGGEITITVTDDGPGIDPEIMPKIFTKFATKSERGTGLGLYISNAIVLAHGGRMWAENNAGRGAKFTVVLPG